MVARQHAFIPYHCGSIGSYYLSSTYDGSSCSQEVQEVVERLLLSDVVSELLSRVLSFGLLQGLLLLGVADHGE